MSKNTNGSIELIEPTQNGSAPAIVDDDEDNELARTLRSKLRDMYLQRRHLYESLMMFKDLVVYALFLVVLTFCVEFVRPSEEAYYMSHAIDMLIVEDEFIDPSARVFGNWLEMANADDFYMWGKTVLMSGVFQSQWYGDHTEGYLYGVNKVLGPPIFRQVRIRGDTCDIVDYEGDFPYPKGCFSYSADEDTIATWDWIPGGLNGTHKYGYETTWDNAADNTEMYETVVNVTESFPYSFATGNPVPYEYYSGDELEEFSYWGKVQWLPGGGYIIQLPLDELEEDCRSVCSYSELQTDTCPSTKLRHSYCSRNVKLLEELEAHSWIDYSTRAVFVDFTLYNANLDMFAVVRLLAEFPRGGGVVPSHSVIVMDFHRYDGSFAGIRIFVESLFVTFLVYYTLLEFYQMKKVGLGPYLRNMWVWLDWTTILVFWICVGLRLASIAVANSPDTNWSPTWSTDPALCERESYYYIAFVLQQEYAWLGANAFLCYFKTFKYLELTPQMTQLVRTLSLASGEVAYFCAVIIIVFIGYALSGNLVFGSKLESFRTLVQSVWYLFRASIGDIEFQELYDANRVFGPFFYVTFILLVQFVLVNMFVAIVTNAYFAARRDPNRERSEARLLSLKNEIQRVKDTIGAALSKKFRFFRGDDDDDADVEASKKTDYELPLENLAKFLGKDMDFLTTALSSVTNLSKALEGTFKLTYIQADSAAAKLFARFDTNNDGSLVDDMAYLRNTVSEDLRKIDIELEKKLLEEEDELGFFRVKDAMTECSETIASLAKQSTSMLQELEALKQADMQHEAAMKELYTILPKYSQVSPFFSRPPRLMSSGPGAGSPQTNGHAPNGATNGNLLHDK